MLGVKRRKRKASAAPIVHIVTHPTTAMSRPDSNAPTRGTQLVSKSCALLRLIANTNHQGARLSDLTLHSSLQQPTVRRILRGLMDEGMVRQDLENRRYFLGPLLFELGVTAAHRYDLAEIAGPSLDCIARQTGDTVYLVQRSGLDAVCLARREGSFPVQVLNIEVGSRRPLGAAAGSLAILMSLPVDEQRAIVKANESQMKQYERLTGLSTLEAIKRSRELGFALMPVNVMPYVSAVAVAIPSLAGPPNASLSVSALNDRIMPGQRYLEIAKLLQREAAKIATSVASPP
jgi:DNA-binding IclR family transcriptional regulator